MHKIITILVIAIVFGTQAHSQDGFYGGGNTSCNGGSDGYVELNMYYVYFYCCGYYGPGVGNYPISEPYLYFWSNGETASNIYNLSAGTYYLTLVDYGGNYAIIEVWIQEPDAIQIQNYNLNTNCDTCANGSISTIISGGNAPYTYSWSTGATTSGITNLLYGSYNLTILDDNGCEATEEFFLMYNPPDTQEIALNAGWNMFSTYKGFNIPHLDTLLSSIQGNYSIVKNWEGEVYWPQYSVNTFDSVEMEYGFQIKMSATDTLLLSGNNYVPENLVVNLPAGWSMIGYPRYVAGAITELMDAATPYLLIMKDDDGSVWWPLYGVNQIDTMQVGEAYQIKTDTILNFSYPSYLENH